MYSFAKIIKMYQTNKTYIYPQMSMIDVINENYAQLLVMEHFEIDFSVNNLTVEDICKNNSIDMAVFIVVSNLYNGFLPSEEEILMIKNINLVINFLQKSHIFYKEDKYPELKAYIKKLKEENENKDIGIIEKFFNEYFDEVLEHLDYEDLIAFPYFDSLLRGEVSEHSYFSVKEYQNHHSDIETKLSDLKNLFLKHIRIENSLKTKRKFLCSLFGLENDLKLHLLIEEMILIPLIENIEKEIR